MSVLLDEEGPCVDKELLNFGKIMIIFMLIIGIISQLAISNPNRDVLMTLSKSGLVDLIGKEWYFVRVHDAVQVCLQHVQSLNDASKMAAPLPDDKASFLQRLLKRTEQDSSISALESGNTSHSDSKNTDPQREPLLPRK